MIFTCLNCQMPTESRPWGPLLEYGKLVYRCPWCQERPPVVRGAEGEAKDVVAKHGAHG